MVRFGSWLITDMTTHADHDLQPPDFFGFVLSFLKIVLLPARVRIFHTDRREPARIP